MKAETLNKSSTLMKNLFYNFIVDSQKFCNKKAVTVNNLTRSILVKSLIDILKTGT